MVEQKAARRRSGGWAGGATFRPLGLESGRIAAAVRRYFVIFQLSQSRGRARPARSARWQRGSPSAAQYAIPINSGREKYELWKYKQISRVVGGAASFAVRVRPSARCKVLSRMGTYVCMNERPKDRVPISKNRPLHACAAKPTRGQLHAFALLAAGPGQRMLPVRSSAR